MRPPALASPLERTPDPGLRPASSAPSARSAAATWVAGLSACLAVWMAVLASGCTGSEWPDRDPIEVRGAPVDTLEFLPAGSRYVLIDSLTKVRVGGFRLGFNLDDGCARILAFDLAKAATPRAGYAVRLDYRLPAYPDCPLDSGTRDSALSVRFTAADSPIVRLVDSLGAVFDTAAAVRGTLAFDSLELKSPALSTFRGRFFFRDTLGTVGRLLSADSLAACEFLNHAEYIRKSDSLKVIRYSWVTLDPASAPDSCKGAAHGDFLTPVAR